MKQFGEKVEMNLHILCKHHCRVDLRSAPDRNITIDVTEVHSSNTNIDFAMRYEPVDLM